MLQHTLPRRAFFGSLGSLALSSSALASLAAPVKLGFIADLHHDLMHDGLDRMNAFIAAMKQANPDAVIPMGDFAYPKEANRLVIESFNSANKVALHVLGNHDTDAKHTLKQCEKIWGLTAPYYTREIAGLTLIVLKPR
jgi:3',5'-cyclic-AMP phosphodiesterase